MMKTFKGFKAQYLSTFENYLETTVQPVSGTDLEEAMNYSLLANGKRLRPLLLLATVQAFSQEVEPAYPAAAALEMIHTYSLIHDDLPAMDNDDLRRGLPTNHIKFSESTAILAGDSLLTLAFDQLSQMSHLDPVQIVALVRLLSHTAGYQGMVGGQKADIDGEQQVDLPLDQLESIHQRKTGELVRFALVGGAIISGADQEIQEDLSKVATRLGIAYQIRDDIYDVVGNEEELGKAVGADEKLDKSTYPKLLGLDGAYERLEEELESAKNLVDNIAMVKAEFNKNVLVDFIDQLKLKK